MKDKKIKSLSKANPTPPMPPKKTGVGTAGFGDHAYRGNSSAQGAMYTKIIRAITSAVKDGGTDPDTNPALKSAIEQAKSFHIPSANIDNAIKKGTGQIPGILYEKISFSAYGPGGILLMIETLTDNRKRTTAEIRNILNKNHGSMPDQVISAPPANIPKVAGNEAEQLKKLLRSFDEHEDVQNVTAYCDWE